ncbi:MAG: lipopolysaccharide biosynthesis protein [Anaerolineae bacterium]
MMQRRIVRGLVDYLPAKILPALLPFITLPVFTAAFAPAEYGQYVLAYGVSDFLMAATSTGLATGAVRFYTSYRLKSHVGSYFGALFATLSTVVAAAAALAVLVLLMLRPYVSPVLYELLWAALLLFVVNGWFVTLMQTLRAQERSRLYSTLEVGARYLGAALSLLLVLRFHTGPVGLLLGESLGMGTVLVPLFLLSTRGARPAFNAETRVAGRQFWSYAWPLTVGNVAFWGLRLSDRYILQFLRGSADVGLYSVAYNTSARTIDLLIALCLIVPGPILVRLWEEDGRRAAEESLAAVTRLYLLLVMPAVVGLTVIAAPLMRLLADESYFSAYAAVPLAALASAICGLSELLSHGMLLAKRTTRLARNQYIAAGLSLALNLLLVGRLGFIGTALASCLTFALLLVLQARSSAQWLTLRLPPMRLVRIGLASAAMGALAAWTVHLVGGMEATRLWNLVTILGAVAVGVIAYSLALLALGELRFGMVRDLVRYSLPGARVAPPPVGGEAGEL